MKFSTRMNNLLEENEELMGMMASADSQDMIKFSGGFPSPDTYPIEDIKETMIEILETEAKEALSYSSAIGYLELREQIAGRMNKNFQMSLDSDEVLLVSGSQQGLNLSGLLFIDKGDVILFETPSYLGALNALITYEAELVAVPTDNNGMEIEALKEAFEKYGDRIKLIYVNPDYQNPTGRSWSEERRIQFLEVVEKHDVAVLEDAAYAELTFEDELAKPLMWYDKKGQVIYLGTFSKTFCPGLRVGWICASKELVELFRVLKTSVDLSAASILQRQVSHYLRNKDLDAHIRQINKLYKERRDLMLEMIRKEFPKDVKYNIPGGGLFFWLELPENKDTNELLNRAIKEKVTFVPGGGFYPASAKNNEMRLNFSNMSNELIIKGMTILGRLIREYLKE